MRAGEDDENVTREFIVETVQQCFQSEMRNFGTGLKHDVSRENVRKIEATVYDTIERSLNSRVQAMEDACRRVERAARDACLEHNREPVSKFVYERKRDEGYTAPEQHTARKRNMI